MLYQVIEDGQITESYAMPDHDHTHHINRTITITAGDPCEGDNFETVLVDATDAQAEIFLGSAVDYPGRVYHFKKIDSTVNNVVIEPVIYLGERIDGAETLTIHNQWECYTIQSDGITWYII